MDVKCTSSYVRNYFLQKERETLTKPWDKLSSGNRKSFRNIWNYYWRTLRSKWDAMSEAKQSQLVAEAAQHKDDNKKVIPAFLLVFVCFNMFFVFLLLFLICFSP